MQTAHLERIQSPIPYPCNGPARNACRIKRVSRYCPSKPILALARYVLSVAR